MLLIKALIMMKQLPCFYSNKKEEGVSSKNGYEQNYFLRKESQTGP